jgi:hypothetical protein
MRRCASLATTQMQRLSSVVVLLLYAMGMFSAEALAQEVPSAGLPESPRGWFWASIGIGYGSASAVCPACGEEGPQGGSTATVSLGFFPRADLRVGAQAMIWVDRGGIYSRREDKFYRTHLLVVALYSPWERFDGFVQMGAGFAAYNAYDQYRPVRRDAQGNDLPSQVHGEGPGFMAGMGYDARIGTEFLLSPTLQYTYGFLGGLVLNSVQSVDGQGSMHQLGISLMLTFRPAR